MLRRILRRRVLGYTALPMLVVLVATYSLLTRGALTTGAEPGPTATSTRVATATASATTTPATLATATPSPSPSPTATATLAPSPTPTMTPTPPPVPPFQIVEPSLTILEAPCGAVVYAKDPHARLAPASLTKIVTALTAIDHVKLNDRVVSDVSAKALAAKTHSSVMGLEPGMVVTVEDLLYGLFLPSGNDAAIQLAEQVSGSVDAFVQLMNQEAASLGMNDSHFENPHGLDAQGHVSSTYDMALAGMALEQNPELAKVAGTLSYTLPGGLRLDNGNKLLTQYPGTFGVKIGSTDAAKHTIVAAVTRNNRTLYLALFGSDQLYPDSIRLLDWAFSSTSPAC